MPEDKFLIGPFDTGLQDDLPSWLIPEKAFSRLNNAYVSRGRVKKRFGSTLTGTNGGSAIYNNLYSRLRISVDTTVAGDASGNITAGIFTAGLTGQMFSVGTQIFTVHTTGTPVTMLKSSGGGSGTYNTTTGAYVFTGLDANTDIYYYPSYPVMGFLNYEQGSVNNHYTYAFDTRCAYKYDGTSWERSGTIVWHGDETQYFWSTNWQGVTDDAIAAFTTNFNFTLGTPGANDDPMYYYNGTTWADFSAYTKFNSTEDIIISAKIILPFKGRLLLMNTVENTIAGPTNKQYVNRIRYCHNGSPFAANAWLEPNKEYGANKADGAGYIDAPTEEEITSAAFIKDRIIVYFERSTYELAYTGNEAVPFTWQAVNEHLGSEGTFSTVAFDKNVLTVGTTGINSCDGAYVQRIDEEIPDKVFGILKTTAGTKRIYGIRDYFNEMVYWSYLKRSHSADNTFNDSLIVYNYRTGSWSFNDDCINAFGHLEQDKTKSLTDIDAASKKVICGNHKGFIFVVDSSLGSNAQAQSIIDMSYAATVTTLTIPNHNLRTDDFIKIQNVQGLTSWVDGIYKVTRESSSEVKITTAEWTGTYTGLGVVSLVSRMEIETKDLNPYVDKGDNIYLNKVNFNVDKTPYGQITVDYSTSSSTLDMVSEAITSGALLGTNILETSAYSTVSLEAFQANLWHSIYFQAEGTFVKLKMSLSDAQMLNTNIAESTFILNGMVLSTRRGSNG